MADNDDHEIGRQIVGAVRGVIESAHRAVVVDLEKRAKQLALAASRAATAQAAPHCAPHVALFDRSGFAGPYCCCRVHRFHDFPLFDLPGLPGLRCFSRGLRPGRAFEALIGAFIPSGLPSRFLPRGMTWPSDNSSNRSAPATGAASTRRTSTTSPSRCMAPLRVPTS